MAQIVTVAGGFAAGKNELPQTLIDLGVAPGILPAPVGSTGALPTVANGLGVVEEGTIGIVQAPLLAPGGANAIYQYVGSRTVVQPAPPDDVFLVDEWVLSSFYQRGVALLVNTAGSPSPVFFTVLNGDTVAILDDPSRGFIAVTTGTSTVTDVNPGTADAAIRFTAADNVNEAAFNFGVIALPAGFPTLFLIRARKVGPASTNPVPGISGIITLDDGIQSAGISWNLGNVQNQVAFHGAAGQQGAGEMAIADWTRVDVLGQYGSDTGAVPPASGRMTGLDFALGYVPRFSDMSLTFAQGAAGVSAAVRMGATCGATSNTVTFDVQKFVGLRTLL